MRLSFAGLRRFLFALGSLVPLAGFAALVDFDLPAQPADGALLAFSKQAKSEVLFSFEELHRVTSAAVAGRYEPRDALERLLTGTGYVAENNGRGKFVVTLVPPPTGSVRGKLLAPDGTAARGVRVSVADTAFTTVTDKRGWFLFPTLPPGVYRLIAAAAGYQPTQITDVRVDAQRIATLEAQTLRAANELTRLEPFVVQGRSAGSRPFDRGHTVAAPQTATGNLDLIRTQNDALPYTIYDRDQIARSGVVNLNEFLQRNVLDTDAAAKSPEQNASDPFTHSQDNFSAVSSNLSLRGYNADETVILVNGRRLPEMLTSLARSDRGQQPEVNFIPLSLVERVEVLPVSASALYSGNPVGGVINIVLRPEVNATEVSAAYTNAAGHFDAPQSTLSLQHGQSLLDGALRLRLSATLTRTTPATEAELGYIAAKNRALDGAQTKFFRATPNVSSVGATPLFGPGTATLTSVAPGADGGGGLAAFAGRQGVRSLALFDPPGGLANTPDSVDFAYGRQQRGVSYFGSVLYDVFPWLQIGLDGIHARTVVNRGYSVLRGDLLLRADSPQNPFQQDVNVTLNESATQLGQNYGEARLTFSSGVLGFLVKLPAKWRASLDAQYGHNLTQYRGVAGADSDRWQELVDQGIYRPLRDTQVFGAPPEFYDRVLKYYGARGQFATLGDFETLDTALRVTNQSLSLPTGSAALSVGGDYRRTHLARYVIEQRFGDGSFAETPDVWTGRTLQRLSIFGELQAPLVPSRWLPRWIREIEADVAARYVASASNQETGLAPTGGLKLSFPGGFSLRGTIATSNRLPSPILAGQLVPSGTVVGGGGGGEVTFATIKDPQRGGEANANVLVAEALNPDLHPESAVTRTFGLVFQRGEVHRFRASLDFTDTRKSGELQPLDAQMVMDLEGFLTGRVTRAPLAPGDSHGAGLVTSVLTGTFNFAFRHSQNWNTSLDYTWSECVGGRLELYAHGIFLQRYERQVLPNSPVIDELRAPDTTNLGLMKYRANFGAGWSNRVYGYGVDAHYFHSRVLPLAEWQSQGSRQINSHWQFDAYLQSDLARWLPWKHPHFGLRGQLRVNNLLGDPPPRYLNDSSVAGVQAYGDWRGRTFSLSVTATF